MDWALIQSPGFVNSYNRWKLLITEAVWTLYASSDPPLTDVRKGCTHHTKKREQQRWRVLPEVSRARPSLWRESEMCTSGKKGARSKACWLQYGGASGERRVPGKHRWVRTRKSKGDTHFRNQVLRSSQEIFYCGGIQASPHPHRCLWYMCPHSWMLYMQIHYSLNSIYVNPTTH